MITREKVKRAIRNPKLIVRQLNRVYHRKGNEKEIGVFSEDWDNLIILDACRYDTLPKLNHFSEDVEKKISRGSSTIEFLRGSISRRSFPDNV
jgi:hypothetical protein